MNIEWKLVPVEPTREMMLNDSACQQHAHDDMGCIQRKMRVGIWQKMIDAAPQPPSVGDEPEIYGYQCRQSAQEKFFLNDYPHYWQNMPLIRLDDHRAALTARDQQIAEYRSSEQCWNAVVGYILGKGYLESPMEFLRCWNDGDFDAIRREWPDAPKEVFYADPLALEVNTDGE